MIITNKNTFFFESPIKTHSFKKEESKYKAYWAGGGESSNHTISPSRTLAFQLCP